MSKRQAISKKLRFEVFKRDGFKCVYCGAHPPSVLLHADHVVAVAAGGENDIDNLVTACQPCNLGKGARDLTLVPQSLAEKAKLVAEQEEQLLGYQHILQAKRERIESEMWEVAEELEPGSMDKGMRRDWLRSIKMFIDRIGYHSVLEAAEIAKGRYSYGGQRAFLYFCGICWKRVRGETPE